MELNLQTFTPELRLHMGQVTRVVDGGYMIRQFLRPLDQREDYSPGEGARPDEFVLTREELLDPANVGRILYHGR